MIYKALIQPVFDYCDVVWGNKQRACHQNPETAELCSPSNHIQGYDIRSADIPKQLNWEELALRRDKHLSLLMYDTINHKVPKYLSDLFLNSCENNPYKSRLRNLEHNVVLNYIPRTEYYKGSFSYRGAKQWNSLPHDFKASESKAILKKKLSSGRQVVDYP